MSARFRIPRSESRLSTVVINPEFANEGELHRACLPWVERPKHRTALRSRRQICRGRRRHRPLRPGGACQRTHGGRSQHHRDDARGRLEDCPHGGALQRRRISRARGGCQVPLRAHPPTRPRLGFDAIDKRRDFRGVIGIVSAHHGPMAAGLAQREEVTAHRSLAPPGGTGSRGPRAPIGVSGPLRNVRSGTGMGSPGG